MAKKLWSIFTTDMDTCIYTGRCEVQRHHVYSKNKYNKAFSEKYGYIAPLYYKNHPNGANSDHSDYTRWIDKDLKERCQQDFEEKHGTREEFIQKIGRSYL